MTKYTYHTINRAAGPDSTDPSCIVMRNTNEVVIENGEPVGHSFHAEPVVTETGATIVYSSEIAALKATVLPMLDFIGSDAIHIVRDHRGIIRIDSYPVSLMQDTSDGVGRRLMGDPESGD